MKCQEDEKVSRNEMKVVKLLGGGGAGWHQRLKPLHGEQIRDEAEQ